MLMLTNDPKREAGLRIIETSRLLRSLVEQRLKPFGMTRAQYVTLIRLDLQPDLVQTELAEILEIQPIAIVRLLDQLSRDGLVERKQDANDRRCNRLSITDAGRARLAEVSGFKERLGKELFEGISDDDLRHLLNTLQVLHQNIKRSNADEQGAATSKFSKAGAA